jgi:hypothetical protein
MYCGGASGSESSDSDSDSDSESELLAEVDGLLGSFDEGKAGDLFCDCLASRAALSCARAFSFASFSARWLSYCSLPAWNQSRKLKGINYGSKTETTYKTMRYKTTGRILIQFHCWLFWFFWFVFQRCDLVEVLPNSV